MDRKEIVISNVTCSEQFTNYKKADGYKKLQFLYPSARSSENRNKQLELRNKSCLHF